MCGIFGFVLNRPLTPADIEQGRRGTRMLVHRGPDGDGEWSDADLGVYLGHRRLAIIDLSPENAQPMAAGNNVMTYNGELYNFEELRVELEDRGERFATSGDTEVLLKAWTVWGETALDRFDGMFAFGLFDGQHLHLVTDPFGEKPLYWAEDDEGVYFASEAQVLVDLLKLRFAPTADETAAFISLGFIPIPDTGFERLHVVPPATHLIVGASGPRSCRRYWRPPPASPGRGRVEPLTTAELDRLNETLFVSLRRRVRADVPVGLFLSGGTDSVLTAAIVAKDLGLELQAFTVSYPDGQDESQAAARIADFLGLPHRLIDSREDDSWREASSVMANLLGVPSDNLTAMSVQQMSARARRHITVALSGIGGDEIFYGYNKHAFLYRHRKLYRLMPPLMNASRWLDPLIGRIHRWRVAARLFRGDRGWQFLSLKNDGLGELLAGIPGAPGWARNLFPGTGPDLAYRVRDFDLNVALPSFYIPAIERGSMRASLEVRTPFLSRRLVEDVAEMDQRAFLAFGKKGVLRRILHRYVPKEILETAKLGFVFPAGRYLDARSGTAPAIRGVPAAIADEVWRNRRDGGYKSLAVRLSVLEAFQAAR